MDNAEVKHVRRPRYKGTHPQSFETKYKERQPEKYSETVSKIIQKGNTPAGMHRSICVKEILDFLQIKPGETGLDATLGYGGHSLEMLKCLQNSGHLYAIDADPLELSRTQERLSNLGYGPTILTIRNMNFCKVDELMFEVGQFDFVLADLGISSMQIDNPKRGFSFKSEGPLDLRLNPNIGRPAFEVLKKMNLEDIQTMLEDNADEPYAEQISKAIMQAYLQGKEIVTTTQLYKIIHDALFFLKKETKEEEIKKSMQRSFQALRIAVNHEFVVLHEFLTKLPDIVKKGGRIAILSFHSGEDRLVKKSFQQNFRDGIYQSIALEAIRPSYDEQKSNTRSRSAKLRWAIRA